MDFEWDPGTDPEWGHETFRAGQNQILVNGVRPIQEIHAQYTTLIEMAEAYEGDDAAYLAWLVGAAYTLKWVLGEENGSEFVDTPVFITLTQGHTTEP